MISNPFPVKKLLLTAVYTSPLIAALATLPLSFLASGTVLIFFYGVSIVSFLIFAAWMINIGLAYQVQRNPDSRYLYYFRYIIGFAACIALVFFIREITWYFAPQHPPHPRPDFTNQELINMNRGRIFGNFAIGFCLNSVILVMQDLVLLRERQAAIQLENAQLKIKNIEATNQQLKQQIHPHFLFNSLNTLKSLIKKNPDLAEEYLLKLSDFLRSSISSDKQNTVGIRDELKLCSGYLEMQKMRFSNALQYSIEIPEDVKLNGHLPAFSLQLLIENAIKHNAMTNESPLKIRIFYRAGRILVSNNIQTKRTVEQSMGIGLTNLSERYKILCGDELKVIATETSFTVSIKVINHEGSNYRG